MSELRRTTPMKRTAFKTKPITHGLARSKSKPTPRKLKSKGPKMTPIRKSAKGQECTLQFSGICNHDPETTVLCHSPFLSSGRGMGIKAPDTDAVYGCSCCHNILDRRAPRPEWLTLEMIEGIFIRAKSITHSILKRKNLI